MGNKMFYYGELKNGSGTLYSTSKIEEFIEIVNNGKYAINTIDVRGDYLMTTKEHIQSSVRCSEMRVYTMTVADIAYVEIECRFSLAEFSSEDIIKYAEFINNIEELTAEKVMSSLSDRYRRNLDKCMKAYLIAQDVVRDIKEKEVKTESRLDSDIIDEYKYCLHSDMETAKNIAKIVSNKDDFEYINEVCRLVARLPYSITDEIEELYTSELDTSEAHTMREVAECLLDYVAPKAIDMIKDFELGIEEMSKVNEYLIDSTNEKSDEVVKALDYKPIDEVKTVNELCMNIRREKILKCLEKRVS